MTGVAQKDFKTASARKPKKVYPKPICVRFTDNERAELERKAGDLTLSAYVRSRCVGKTAERHRTRGKRPVKDYEALCKVLGALGKSKLPNNVNQIAKAINTGTLALPAVTEAAILEAAYNIAYIRLTLIKALGLKEDDT
ncbi:plasmid mobilization protein [Litorimonas haliclonae]|uniref:plasmid mobilization protein n=1 Tax=Litorimonas haliclonae TaxID=2081977 RepID=UPI0039F0D6C7